MLPDNPSPNTLRPIFSHALSLKLETIKLDAFIQNVSAGQTLSGKVVQVLPEQKAVVDIQGEKLLLQFPRAVNTGQNIAIKVEQVNPSLILKLTKLSSIPSSHNAAPEHLTKEGSPLNTQESDKMSLQGRSPHSHLETSGSDKSTHPSVNHEQATQNGRLSDSFSKTYLKQTGIEVGQRIKAEVLKVVDRETIQVRFNEHLITIKHFSAQKFQPGEPVIILAKSIPSGKFALEVERIPVMPSTARPPVGSSILKNYLPSRQSMNQVLAGLKKLFMEGSLAQLKKFNIDSGQLKQLQDNLQKIASGEFKVPDPVQLKEIVDRSGFHYEAKVKSFVLEPGLSDKGVLLENDLKGQLMRLARQLEQVSTGVADGTTSEKFIGKLMAQLNSAINNIELQQLTHHFSKEEQHPLLLQLPENLLSEEDRFKVYIMPDQREGAGSERNSNNRIFNLVFLLHLSALGDLRIETKILKDEISIYITGPNSDAIQFIETQVPELENLFQDEGFSISVTSRHQTEVSMEVPDSLGQLLIDTPLQMVDLKT